MAESKDDTEDTVFSLKGFSNPMYENYFCSWRIMTNEKLWSTVMEFYCCNTSNMPLKSGIEEITRSMFLYLFLAIVPTPPDRWVRVETQAFDYCLGGHLSLGPEQWYRQPETRELEPSIRLVAPHWATASAGNSENRGLTREMEMQGLEIQN